MQYKVGEEKQTEWQESVTFQVPWNNLTFYPDCKVLVETEF